MTDAPDDATFHAEALKLLLQVAWANDHLHPKERAFLQSLANAWKVPAALEALLAGLAGGEPLPQPDLSIVRTRADKVIRAAEALVAADGEVDTDEDQLLSEVKLLLRGG